MSLSRVRKGPPSPFLAEWAAGLTKEGRALQGEHTTPPPDPRDIARLLDVTFRSMCWSAGLTGVLLPLGVLIYAIAGGLIC
jgi:hypothetical protein